MPWRGSTGDLRWTRRVTSTSGRGIRRRRVHRRHLRLGGGGGRYTRPRKLGLGINAPGRYNRCPFIAPDSRYLLFNRDGMFLFFPDDANGKILPYWVDARFIEEFRARDGRELEGRHLPSNRAWR